MFNLIIAAVFLVESINFVGAILNYDLTSFSIR